jgi:putative FmdB family regulatory protein
MHLIWKRLMIRRFDFKCTHCQHIEEQWVDSSDEFATCPECGDTAQRIISSVRTHFKGTGWPDADDRWAKDHERAAK